MGQLKGVIFDMDGVITDTAKVHSLAWKSMFDGYFQKRSAQTCESFSAFTDKDYLTYVDGRPRMQGVASFLASRGVELPYGHLDDEPGVETICGLGNAKNAGFQEILEREGPEVYPGTVAFIKELLRRGIKVGVASSSCNCKRVLELAGLESLFETRVDGSTSREKGLSGKPAPDIFTTAAADLCLHPNQCMVVEDAISGVQAGAAGHFGLVLGVARETAGEVLLAKGADLVVTDLGDISVDEVEAWFDKGLEEDGWHLRYSGFDPDDEKLRETLTTVGNGYLGVRGSMETERAGEVSYPGTYLAGVFNNTPTSLHGRTLFNNDLVNCPNWLLVEFRIGHGHTVSPLSMRVLSYDQDLNLRDGTMGRQMVVQDQQGRIMRLCSARLASMADPHLLALRFTVEPINFSAPITFRSSLDGSVSNDGVARYRALNQHHLRLVHSGKIESGVCLHMETTVSNYQIVMGARAEMSANGKRLAVPKKLVRDGALVGEEMQVPGHRGVRYTLEKVVCVHTSRDTTHPKNAAIAGLVQAGTYKQLYRAHADAWARLWKRADMVIEGDRLVQRTARLHAYHLLTTASPHNVTLDVGMPARGLSGEAYRGHVFWDEVYILPFYDLRFPEVSKALLEYRYNRLPGARAYAAEHGYAGAMFPWQTADGGDEETQEMHYNPQSDSWGPDLSRRQRHVSIAVFYNVWRYARTADDAAFLNGKGAELLLSIAQFWGTIARKEGSTGNYHIDGVMGPDEFHEKRFGAEADGLRDNGYTNIMASWLLERALEVAHALPGKTLAALKAKLALTEEDLSRWEEIARQLNVIVKDGIIEQFDGYFDLEELDWDRYREKYGAIERLDRLLKAEGDSPDRYQLAKQADTLMAFYLLSPEQVKDILAARGIDVGDAARFLKRNYEYYEGRTSHGSTLSKVVHAVIAAHFGDDHTAWQWFEDALVSDIHDTQGGSTPEGIHCGVMAGTLEIITRYFAGVDTSGEVLAINPHLPEHINRLAMPLRFRRTEYELELTPGQLRLSARGGKQALHVNVQGKRVDLIAGKTKTIKLK